MSNDINEIAALRNRVDALECALEATNKRLEALLDSHESRAIVAAADATRALVTASNVELYNKIVNEINEAIIPAVESLSEWVEHTTLDCDGLVDHYRRLTEIDTWSAQLAITDGKRDTRIIAPAVRTFFKDYRESSSSTSAEDIYADEVEAADNAESDAESEYDSDESVVCSID